MGDTIINKVAVQHKVKPFRVLFFCGERSPWGYSHLAPLLSELRIELVGVVMATEKRWTNFRVALSGEEQKPPDRVTKIKQLVKTLIGRKNRTDITHSLLSKHNVPVLLCEDVNSPESIDLFKTYEADLLLCAAYPQIFKPELLSICPKGAFNSHPSLLPRCRGAHPVFWAIASGETKSGATIHYMTRELDQGDIVGQIEVDLPSTETYSGLYTKLVGVIPDLVLQFVTFLVTPGSHAIPQDHSKATCFRNDRRIHRRIFWSEMAANQIHNLVRACNGSAYCWFGDRKILIRQVEVANSNRNMTNGISVPAGTIVDVYDDMPVVVAQQGFVLLKHLTSSRKMCFEIGQILH